MRIQKEGGTTHGSWALIWQQALWSLLYIDYESFQCLFEAGISNPSPYPGLQVQCHKLSIPGKMSFGEHLHSELSDFSAHILFLFDYHAASFLFSIVFFNFLGVAHGLQFRRYLENVHRLDDKWMNDYDETTYRTEPQKEGLCAVAQLTSIAPGKGQYWFRKRRSHQCLLTPIWNDSGFTSLFSPLLSAFLPENQRCLQEAELWPPQAHSVVLPDPSLQSY